MHEFGAFEALIKREPRGPDNSEPEERTWEDEKRGSKSNLARCCGVWEEFLFYFWCRVKAV